MSRIVVIGSLHYDMIVKGPRLPRLGETLAGSGWETKCGGKGGNQAVEAARQGASVTMIGCVGRDDMGLKLVENLTSVGVDTRFVRAGASGSGLSVVISESAGDYAAVIVSGANQELSHADLDNAGEVMAAASVVVLQNEIPDGINLAAARKGRAAGSLVVLNAAPARPLLPDLRGLIDVLVVNAVEAEMLGSEPVIDLASAARAARSLAPHAPVVIVTAGGDGVAVRSMEAAETVAPHAVQVVSTHGAGDAFVGALVARLAAGDGIMVAAVYANAVAALIVSTEEASRGALRQADARRMLEISRPS